MKYSLILLFLFLRFEAFSQNSIVKLDITITDTIKPYFLDIFFNKGNKMAKRFTVLSSGSYLIKDLVEGDYDLEVFSFQSSARRLYLKNMHFYKDSTNLLSIVYPPPCKFIYSKGYKPLCPFNHSDKIIPIIYGFPTSKTMKKANKGLIHLGGCMISDCDPHYYCTIHKIEL